MTAEEKKVEEKKAKEKKEKEEVKPEEKKEEAEQAEPKQEPEAKEAGEEHTKPEAKKRELGEVTVELTKKMKDVLKTIEEMTVLELSRLVKALEERFGVSAAAPVMMQAAGVGGGGGKGEGEEEKTMFDAVLAQVGDKKIQVIKEIRTVTTLGLKEAKDLVDQAPKPIKQGVTKEEAEEIKKKLEAVGATVELK